MKKASLTAFLIPAILLIAGRDTALTVGAKTIGIRSGNSSTRKVTLRRPLPFDKVWLVARNPDRDVGATDVEWIRKDRPGAFTAMIHDEKVRISVDYVGEGDYGGSIMVGTSGNNLASQLIHDRLATMLKTP